MGDRVLDCRIELGVSEGSFMSRSVRIVKEQGKDNFKGQAEERAKGVWTYVLVNPVGSNTASHLWADEAHEP